MTSETFKMNELKIQKISPLEEWQTKFFKSFYDKAIIQQYLNVEITIGYDEITIYGSIEVLEKAFVKVCQALSTIRKEALDVSDYLLDYFIATDMIKLNHLIKDQNLKILLIKSNQSILMIGNDETTLSCFKQIIQSKFTYGIFHLSNQSLQELVATKRFEEFLQSKQIEMNISEQERKQMIRVTNQAIVCIGEIHLVNEWLTHINKFIDFNTIYTIDLSSLYHEEDLIYLATVAYDEIDTLSKQIERNLHVEQAVELNFNTKPFVRIKCNNYFLKTFKKLLNEFISSKIVLSYPFESDIAMLSLFEEKHILDEIKSIEKRNRCIIKHKKDMVNETIQSTDMTQIDKVKASTNQEMSINYSFVNVVLYHGNILETDTECILNPTDGKLTIGGTVADLLLSKEPKLLEEIDKLRPLFKQIGVTTASESPSFKFNKICHIDIQNIDEKKVIFEALFYMNALRCKSIAIPLIGIENAKMTAKRINEALEKYSTSVTPLFLSKIRLCFFQSDQFAAIANELSFLRPCLSDVASNSMTGISTQMQQPTRLIFQFTSNNKDRIIAAKREIEAIANREIKIEEYEDDNFHSGNINYFMNIEKHCEENKVRYEWDMSRKKIKLSGIDRNVSNALEQINKCTIEFYKQLKAELISKNVQWQILLNNEWHSFNLYLNSQLETKYMSKDANKKIRLLDEQGNYFVADVKQCEVVLENDLTKRKYKIKRTETELNLNLPSNWTSNKAIDKVRLDEKSDEFKRVLNIFLNNGLDKLLKKVISIDRIENKILYTQYMAQKEFFQTKYGLQCPIEKILFHGTNEDSVESIWRTGFNRSYAGKNATAFGRGVYFAKNSCYSHHYTDIRKGKFVGHMFVCNVLIGKCAVGNPSMNVPPDDTDSTVNSIPFPNIFVIYKDPQAYPGYLITYN